MVYVRLGHVTHVRPIRLCVNLHQLVLRNRVSGTRRLAPSVVGIEDLAAKRVKETVYICTAFGANLYKRNVERKQQ